MAYKPSKKKLQTLREEPNLFSILDDGDVINTTHYKQENTNTALEPTIELENGLKSQELALENQQEPLPYVVKTQINKASMKSKEVLKNLNAEKRASLENESVTITEIENSNKEQEIKGNTKSDDEVKQHIEQVIEKEIGKGAEIISSKEVAITNNVDYYENEEELETTQSRSRR